MKFAQKLRLAGSLTCLTLPTIAQAEPFSGAYVGTDIGFERSGRLDKSGVTYGLFAGYDARIGSDVVLGIEGRIGDSAINRTVVRTTSANETVARSSIGFQFGGTARIGLLATPHTLLFVRGGWERVDVKATSTRTPLPPTSSPAPIVSDFSLRDHLITLGAGAEQAFGPRWRARLSYDYGDKARRHQLRLGVIAAF
ncbi:MAG: outer membrane beta-barrel protein [Sphingobium sp.]|nr:outer membrane beta-barrel protein [Sphingobium sp.]